MRHYGEPETTHPIAAILSLARAPSASAGRIARLLRLIALIFVPLILILVTDAALLSRGHTILWRYAIEGSAAMDAVMTLLGISALLALFLCSPVLEWVARRLRTIEEVERVGPPRVPEGRSPLERYLKHLQCDVSHRHLLEEMLRTASVRATVQGVSGRGHRFDLYMERLPRRGAGGPLSFFLRQFTEPPTIADIEDMEAAVRDVTARTGAPPWRAVVLYSPMQREGFVEEVADEVYERLMERHITGRAGLRRWTVAMELVTELPDGSYDLVPFRVPGGQDGQGL